MRKVISISLWALVSLAAGQAVAADVYTAGGYKDAPIYTPAASWTGFYLGGQIGGAWADGSAALTENFLCAAPCMAPPPQFYHRNLGEKELIEGVHAGYNWQRGHTVFGLEGDVSFGDSFDYLASFRGRLGWAENNWLFYGTGGVALISAPLKGSFTFPSSACLAPCVPSPPAVFPYNASEHEAGYVLGGGIETKLTQNLSFGVEGLYYGFGADRYKHGAVDQVAAEGISEIAVARARLSWHFTGDPLPLK